MDTSQVPQQLKDMAENLGVDIEQVLASLSGSQQQRPPAAPAGSADAAAASAIGAGVGTLQQTPGGAQVSSGVTARESETPEQTLQRELAVTQQELQQTRSNMQALQDARVVGSGGLSGPIDNTPPNLGGIEPGIRFAVRNGLIAAEDLEHKLGPIIVDLFKKDLGGVI